MQDFNNVKKDIRILVVDDYALTRSMVQSILKSVGFSSITEAENGKSAIVKIDEERIDLVVCDWNMPEVTGVDVLRHMRTKKRYEHVPFIMLTAEGYKRNILEAIQAGVSDYIVKPFTAAVLLDKVSAALKKVQREQGKS